MSTINDINERQTPDDVLIALRRIIRATDLYSKSLSKTVGLTSPQLLVLDAVESMGEVPIGQLARRISLSQATVTTILDRLEARRLLYRERSQLDKRRVHVKLTKRGREVLAEAPTLLQQSFIDRFHALQDWEQSMIKASLQRIAAMMDAEGLDASPVLDVGELDRPSSANDEVAPEQIET